MSFGIVKDIRQAMANPFGLDFMVHEQRVYIPLGSAINCLGYNDYLERAIGITRLALGLLALATSSTKKERVLAAAHAFRGVLEMMGNWERELLIIDCIATLYNLAMKTQWGQAHISFKILDDSTQPELST